MSDVHSIPAQQVKELADICRLLTVTPDLDLMFVRIAEAVCSLLRCERASIFLHDEKTGQLWSRVALQSGEIRVPAGVGIVGHSFANNQVINVPDAYADPRFFSAVDGDTKLTRNLLSVPMLNMNSKPVGVVQAMNRRPGPFDATDEMLLQLLANQAAVAFQRHALQAEAVTAAALAHEMALARRIQQALVPAVPLRRGGIEADGWSEPTEQTGGDGFDLWWNADGRLGIFLGDASGHGLAPALVISQVRTLVRTLAELYPDPHRILGLVNQRLKADLRTGMFACAFLAFMDADGTLTWFSAGQAPILLRGGAGRPIESLPSMSPPLAVTTDSAGDRSETIHLAPGGMLAAISDGIFEAPDAAGRLFGAQRVIELLANSAESSPRDTIDAIRGVVAAWQGGGKPVDDQTILLVQRKT